MYYLFIFIDFLSIISSITILLCSIYIPFIIIMNKRQELVSIENSMSSINVGIMIPRVDKYKRYVPKWANTTPECINTSYITVSSTRQHLSTVPLFESIATIDNDKKYKVIASTNQEEWCAFEIPLGCNKLFEMTIQPIVSGSGKDEQIQAEFRVSLDGSHTIMGSGYSTSGMKNYPNKNKWVNESNNNSNRLVVDKPILFDMYQNVLIQGSFCLPLDNMVKAPIGIIAGFKNCTLTLRIYTR